MQPVEFVLANRFQIQLLRTGVVELRVFADVMEVTSLWRAWDLQYCALGFAEITKLGNKGAALSGIQNPDARDAKCVIFVNANLNTSECIAV
jgi:hypothetical protein